MGKCTDACIQQQAIDPGAMHVGRGRAPVPIPVQYGNALHGQWKYALQYRYRVLDSTCSYLRTTEKNVGRVTKLFVYLPKGNTGYRTTLLFPGRVSTENIFYHTCIYEQYVMY